MKKLEDLSYWGLMAQLGPWMLAGLSVPIMVVSLYLQFTLLFVIYFLAYVVCSLILVRRYARRMAWKAEVREIHCRLSKAGQKGAKAGKDLAKSFAVMGGATGKVSLEFKKLGEVLRKLPKDEL